MKYLFQIIMMLGNIMLILVAAAVLHLSNYSFVVMIMVALALWAWSDQGGFVAWKPKDIKKFLNNYPRLEIQK